MTALAAIDRHIVALKVDLERELNRPLQHTERQLIERGLEIASLRGRIQGLTIAKVELETATDDRGTVTDAQILAALNVEVGPAHAAPSLEFYARANIDRMRACLEAAQRA